MAYAGKDMLVYFGSAYDGLVAAAGMKSFRLNRSINLLDASVMNTQFVKRIAGLSDFTLTGQALFEVDATSQGLIRSTAPGTAIFWKAVYDPAATDWGYGCASSGGGSLVEQWEMGGEVNGLLEMSFTIRGAFQAIEEIGTAD